MAKRRERRLHQPGTISRTAQKAHEALAEGNRTWEEGYGPFKLRVVEYINEAEVSAGRNAGRLCFHYAGGMTPPPRAERFRLERRLVPVVLRAVGLDPRTPVETRNNAGCFCGCSPGFLVKDIREKQRELLVEISLGNEGDNRDWLHEKRKHRNASAGDSRP